MSYYIYEEKDLYLIWDFTWYITFHLQSVASYCFQFITTDGNVADFERQFASQLAVECTRFHL